MKNQKISIFSNIELTEDYHSKKEMITLINSLLLEKSEKEIKMINSIIRNIFDTYKK